MATLAILSLVTSTGTNLSLETNKVVYAHNDANSNAVLTYVDNGGRVQVVTLTVSTATLQGYSTGVLFTVSIINTDLSTTTWCLNNGRVIKITPTIGGLCRVVYWNEATSEPIVLNVNASASTVSTNCTQTYPVTDNRTGQLYYINKGFTGNITAETETGLDLSSAIVVSRGTAMVAGTTTLTLTGGTKTTDATVLVTNTEVAGSTGTIVDAGTTMVAGTTVLTTTTGIGTAATFMVTNTKAVSVTATPVAAGNGYNVGDTIKPNGGTGTNSVFTVTHIKVSTAPAVNVGGSGFVTGNTVSFTTDGTGTPALFTVTAVAGVVTALTAITNAGDYTVRPALNAAKAMTAVTGIGTGLTVVLAASCFGGLTIGLTTAGDYTVNPTSTTASATTFLTGTGTGLTATFVMGAKTATVLTRGDFTVNPTLTAGATTGGGNDATITVVMGAKTVSVSNAGIYTAAPANPVSTTGGGGDATITATFSNGTITGAIIKYDGKRNASYETLKVNNTQAALVTAINALS
jgi:hypothetical protein